MWWQSLSPHRLRLGCWNAPSPAYGDRRWDSLSSTKPLQLLKTFASTRSCRWKIPQSCLEIAIKREKKVLSTVWRATLTVISNQHTEVGYVRITPVNAHLGRILIVQDRQTRRRVLWQLIEYQLIGVNASSKVESDAFHGSTRQGALNHVPNA